MFTKWSIFPSKTKYKLNYFLKIHSFVRIFIRKLAFLENNCLYVMNGYTKICYENHK